MDAIQDLEIRQGELKEELAGLLDIGCRKRKGRRLDQGTPFPWSAS